MEGLIGTMAVSSVLKSPNNNEKNQGNRHQTVSVLAIAPTLSQLPSEAGATVYVPGNAISKADSPVCWHIGIPKEQSGEQHYQPAHVVKIQINPELDNSKVISTVNLTSSFNENDSLLNENNNNNNSSSNNNNLSAESCIKINVVNESENIINSNDNVNKKSSDEDNMIKEELIESVNVNVHSKSRSNTCFYYGSFQNPIGNMVMSSGQCSPSDTLDSGTCSDLDGTPPPLLKKKNSSTIIVNGSNGNSVGATGQHNRTGSLTSSGAEIDSDDNESNISCDSLNNRELAASRIAEQTINGLSCGNSHDLMKNVNRDIKQTVNELDPANFTTTIINNHKNNINKNGIETNETNNHSKLSTSVEFVSSSSSSSSSSPSISSLTKSSSKPRVTSPNPLVNGSQKSSPVIKECTYEERKKQQVEEVNTAIEQLNHTRENGTKYLYDDDRFYKFHMNELLLENDDDNNNNKKKIDNNETDECFAGYKILDKEAIKSAKGTIRGVKNRVRAGIATFLQNPSSKSYKQKDGGKVVVYTTSMRVVPRTMIACMKMLQILNTHMVLYEERDLFGSRELQTELKERLGCDAVEVPQLFIDGQYIGDADAVERLNESQELRIMLKPYKYSGVKKVCSVCGGAGAIPCISCHGSKKSWRWHGFLNEVSALRCTNCDEMGLMSCPSCIR